MNLFKRKCQHDWEVMLRSNVLQQDEMGYPLRLCICRCTKCGAQDQRWLDICVSELGELQTGESVLLQWRDKR